MIPCFYAHNQVAYLSPLSDETLFSCKYMHICIAYARFLCSLCTHTLYTFWRLPLSFFVVVAIYVNYARFYICSLLYDTFVLLLMQYIHRRVRDPSDELLIGEHADMRKENLTDDYNDK